MRRGAAAIVLTLAAVALLAWLRDPAWLAGIESGLGRWERDDRGIEYRWTAGRASFFVPADARLLVVAVRVPLQAEDWPVTATISIDDRVADRFTLADGEWQRREIRLPPRGSRRLRRIDIHADRTRSGNRGVQLGRIVLR